MKRKPTLAPRNPLVAPSMFRKAGAHGKNHKAKRRADKVDLQRGCSSQVEHPAFTRTARVRASPPPPGESKRLALQPTVCVFNGPMAERTGHPNNEDGCG